MTIPVSCFVTIASHAAGDVEPEFWTVANGRDADIRAVHQRLGSRDSYGEINRQLAVELLHSTDTGEALGPVELQRFARFCSNEASDCQMERRWQMSQLDAWGYPGAKFMVLLAKRGMEPFHDIDRETLDELLQLNGLS